MAAIRAQLSNASNEQLADEDSDDNANPSWDDATSVSDESEYNKPPINRVKMLGLLGLVGSVEGVDIVLFPCMLFALQRDLGVTMHGIALLSTLTAMAWNVGNPLWAIAADRGLMRRKDIIFTGCVAQGLLTMGMASANHLWSVALLRAMVGFALASLRPIAHGILAELVSDASRGKAFGGMASAMQVGTILGIYAGTTYGREEVFGYPGWRVMFAFMGSVSTAIGFVIWHWMDEPPRVPGWQKRALKQGTFLGTIWSELCMLYDCLSIPTFSVILLQGFFGGIAWSAWHYKALFLQLLGIPDKKVSYVLMASRFAAIFGHVTVGFMADCISRRSRNYGRTIFAQVTMLASFPLVWSMFAIEPPVGQEFSYYLWLQVSFFFVCGSVACAINKPVLAEIINPERRATVMAWEATLEHGASAVFGNAVVAFIAEDVYGYNFRNARAHGHHHAHGGQAVKTDLENGRALGHALLFTYMVPMFIAISLFTVLYWSYPRDRKLQKVSLVPSNAQCGSLENLESDDET